MTSRENSLEYLIKGMEQADAGRTVVLQLSIPTFWGLEHGQCGVGAMALGKNPERLFNVVATSRCFQLRVSQVRAAQLVSDEYFTAERILPDVLASLKSFITTVNREDESEDPDNPEKDCCQKKRGSGAPYL